MGLQTLLIAGSDSRNLAAIRDIIPDGRYLVHTVSGDAEKLARLLRGIDFDVILVDHGSEAASELQEIVNVFHGGGVTVHRESGHASDHVSPGERLLFPFDSSALALAVDRACTRKQRRIFIPKPSLSFSIH